MYIHIEHGISYSLKESESWEDAEISQLAMTERHACEWRQNMSSNNDVAAQNQKAAKTITLTLPQFDGKSIREAVTASITKIKQIDPKVIGEHAKKAVNTVKHVNQGFGRLARKVVNNAKSTIKDVKDVYNGDQK